MTLSAMQQLLETHLNTLEPKPSIAWPNVPFTPNITEPYIEPKLIPTSHTDESIDRLGSMVDKAKFDIFVYVPKSTGSFVMRNWLKVLESHFPRTLILSNNDSTVRVRQVTRTQSFYLDTWYTQGITVSCYSIGK